MIPKLKICGLTRREDLEKVIELGVDYAGIIMTDKSKRFVDLTKAKSLLHGLKKGQTQLVIVFQDPTQEEVEKVLQELPVDLLQFHGNERAKFTNQFNFPFIKALSIFESPQIKNYDTPYILLDAVSPSARGGTGEVLDFSAAQKVIRSHTDKRIFLAGGLTPENLSECLKITTPFAFDISSGVEISPGIKDHQKIIHLLRQLRSLP